MKKVERQIRAIIETIKDGLYPPSMKAEMNALEDRKEVTVHSKPSIKSAESVYDPHRPNWTRD